MNRRSSRVLVAGLVLLTLGIGNWRMGGIKLEQYGANISEAVASDPAVVHGIPVGTAGILFERSDARDVYEDASMKYQQYRVIERGGRVFAVLGLFMSLGALLRRWAVPNK